MKTKLNHILMMITIVIMVLACVGCPGPETPDPSVNNPVTPSTPSGDNSEDGNPQLATANVSFTLKAMPWDALGLKAGVLLLNSNYDELGFVELGTIEHLDQQSFTGTVDTKTKEFRICLYNQTRSDTKYNGTNVSYSKGTTGYEINGLWKIAGKTDNLAPLYGLNACYVETRDLSELTSLTFTDKKFYIFKFENVQNQVLKIEYKRNSTDIFISSDLNKILSQTDMIKVNTDTYSIQTVVYRTDPWESDVLYMLIQPADYAVQGASIQVSVVNWTQLSKASINSSTMRFSELLSDSEILFTGENERYSPISNPKRKELYSYNFETDTATLLKECDSEIDFLIPYGNGFFFSSGKDVWFLDKTSRTFTKKTTMAGDISGLCFVGDELLVMYKKDFSSNSTVPVLFNPETFVKNTNRKASSNFTCDAAFSLVYDQTTGRLFYLTTQYYLYYIWWDTTKNDFMKLDSSYNSSYSKTLPFKRFGTTNYLVTGSGNLFHMDGDPSPTILGGTLKIEQDDILLSGIANAVGTSFIDIEFTDDYYYTLTNTDDGYIVRKFELQNFDPEAVHTSIEDYSVNGQKGAELVLRSDDILVTSVSKNPVYSGYYPVSVIKLDYNLNLSE